MPSENPKMISASGFTAFNADEPVDLKDVTVNKEKSLSERRNDYIGQIRNPYLFKVGSTIVKIEFGNGKSFARMISDIIIAG